MRGELHLPKEFRPDRPYRRCAYGIDLSRTFITNLQAIDPWLYPVFHMYRVLWDSIINMYDGELEDPRYTVNYDYGEMNFGYVLTDGEGRPLEDGSWHIWRWCYPHGVAHVVKLESLSSEYLELVLKRLHLQACWTNKYGFLAYNKLLDNVREEDRTQLMKDREEMFQATQDENRWLLRRAMDEAARGNINPTNPQHESIISYPGQSNKSRIIRPLEDKEGGLYVPE
jgi:hypothetical protein